MSQIVEIPPGGRYITIRFHGGAGRCAGKLDCQLNKSSNNTNKLKQSKRDAQAIVADGSVNRATKVLASLGTNGRHPGNAARDFRRRVMRKLCCKEKFPPIFAAKLPFAHPTDTGVVWHDQHMCLPHELFGFLYGFPEEFEARLKSGGSSSCRQWWEQAQSSPWYCAHACRAEVESDASLILPCRLYGDDAQYQSTQKALVLTWSSVLCRLHSSLSRLLVTLLPLKHAIGATYTKLYTIICWSMTCLLLSVSQSRDSNHTAIGISSIFC